MESWAAKDAAKLEKRDLETSNRINGNKMQAIELYGAV